MGSDRPVFIVGCPRSGTTMLQLMLHAHPRIAIPPENRFVIPSYAGRRQFGDLRKPQNRRKLARSIVASKGTQFRDLGLDADAVVEEIVAGPPTVGSALGIVFRAYAASHGKPRWGDKRPGYHGHLSFVLRMFPDAQIIHLVRDGRDCVASLKRMPWWERGFYQSVAEWAMAVDSGRRAARSLPDDTFYQLQYEKLVDDPATELKSLCGFLGEDFDQAMTRPAEQATVAVPERKRWHLRTHEDVSTASIGNWKDGLEPWELAVCETALGRRLRAHGYPQAGIALRPTPGQFARYTQAAIQRKVAVSKGHVRDRWLLLTDRAPVQAVLTEGERQHLSKDDMAWLAGAESS